ncbi:Glycosyl transferase family 2 OS=Desulfarculus baarsii (strain ATCC 33931 / DSM 2075 / VKM B-1802 / 2st14) GN=Deba_1006 PE=4 SV=1: Glycos_transf_2 [Gemmata massiliana]|uniref:Glycosyltransferase 2-like domain-containing protein n=1 Tax=Gemmata massiliana TaxID=1210884 RepID=A0A6P2D5S6_9BACT|nr:glycosyltransferase family 2 protein [Gemmata massiliana]VTR95454.1 Glycosyl transferase family 2 OS=Desulfarculus baarsii (strain ATCC 33931 / DSM 2075 / VKM B-1802 / 2st14) GN=Deba_1006 PE=4 SV=1: Glycos_transf_2 [Gemmata massiliana]
MRCSLVIPVYNRASLTRECLDRLLASPETRGQELIVVDDCSRDETPALLANYGSKIRVVRHAVNMGYGQGINDGTALASREYIVHLNNDTIPVAGWLDALVRYADAHPRAGAVSSKLLNVDGSVQHAGIVFCAQLRPWHLYRWFPADHPAVNTSRRFQAVTGTSLLVRREAFARAGGFDAALGNSYNDVDFCVRLSELGYESHLCHESVVYHLEGASKTRTNRDEENYQRCAARWRGRVHEDEWDYYLRDGLVSVVRHNDLLEFVVSPLLGRVRRCDEGAATEGLLLKQSKQIGTLLREYIRLRLNTDIPARRGVEEPGALAPLPLGAGTDLREAVTELTDLAERVLEHDAERDALVRRLRWLKHSLPGRAVRALGRLVTRKSA